MAQQLIRNGSGDLVFVWDTNYGAPPRVLGSTLILDKYKQMNVPVLGPPAVTPSYVSQRRASNPFTSFGAEAPETNQYATLAALTAPAWLALLYVAFKK